MAGTAGVVPSNIPLLLSMACRGLGEYRSSHGTYMASIPPGSGQLPPPLSIAITPFISRKFPARWLLGEGGVVLSLFIPRCALPSYENLRGLVGGGGGVILPVHLWRTIGGLGPIRTLPAVFSTACHTLAHLPIILETLMVSWT